MSGSRSPWLRLSGLGLLVRLSELALSFVCDNSQQPESQNKLQRRVDPVYPPEESSPAFILETLSSPEVALRRAATCCGLTHLRRATLTTLSKTKNLRHIYTYTPAYSAP